MSSRKRHIEEMRYAMAHNVTVLVARARLARREMIKAEVAARTVQSCGTRATLHREPSTILGRSLSGAPDQPWMMRD
jgi:hypothetical protein